jgi:hemoglobin
MRRLAVFVFALLLAACSSAPVRDDALYRALGERAGIARAVDAILARVLADARINAKFRASDPAQLAPLLVDQICEAAGGPCTYRGRSMEEAHAGMNIDEAMFAAFVEDVGAGLQDVGASAEVQRQLLAALAPMQPRIVGR